MSVFVKELTRSRSLVASDQPTGAIHYAAYGSSDPEVVELNVLAASPPIFAGLVRDQISITPTDGDESVHSITVSYRKARRLSVPGTGEEIVSFDIEPRQVHVTHSKQTVATYGTDAPSFGGGIGYRKGEFLGTEKFVPQLSFSVTKYLPIATVNNVFVANLRAAAFKVNDALWRNQPAESCMFMGASGSKRNEDDYAISFKFLSVAPETGLTFGTITGVEKGSWEHLWVLTEPSEDETAEFLVELPLAVYCERIYDSVNFPTFLGLPA